MKFDRLVNLIGEEKFNILKKKRIIVFGLGGVGSYAAEVIVRSGLDQIDVVDFDMVEETNLNRQLIALESTVGQYKVNAFKNRALDINPLININTHLIKVNEENISEIINQDFDYVIDCIDDVDAKVSIAKYCLDNNIKFISSMGFANKFKVDLIRIRKMNQTSVCPLAKIMRKKLKVAGYALDFPVVYSEEKPATVLDRLTLGSNAYCPSAAGITLAAHVINEIIGEDI